jgi:uncharacterized protein YndB with AHSA1/START domain
MIASSGGNMRDSIVIERVINSPIERVFDAFITPGDLVNWHHAGDGWQTPYAEVDAVVDGKLKIAYAGPDGKVVFDFEAVYEKIERPKHLAYRLGLDMLEDDGRLVTVDLEEVLGGTNVRLEFYIEHINNKELQRQGWTQHVDNLQAYLEK